MKVCLKCLWPFFFLPTPPQLQEPLSIALCLLKACHPVLATKYIIS